MKQKPAAPALNGLKVNANPMPGPRRPKASVGRYWMNQPGYYLIRLRLQHGQKAMRPLARIP